MQESAYQNYYGIEVTESSTEMDFYAESMERLGYFVAPKIFSEAELVRIREKLDLIWIEQLARYGTEFLERIGDYGQIRGMMTYDPYFYDLIMHPVIKKIVDYFLGETAILHLQNGIVSHPGRRHNQALFHRDFAKNFVCSKMLSINTFIAVDEFNEQTGATWIVPGTHRFEKVPSEEYVKQHKIQVVVPAGSLIVFDSMLWHSGGYNFTANVRRAVNQQYTRPFIKQQLDYPALLKGKVDLESDLAQTLGMWSIPPKNVDEFRVSDPS